MAVMPHGKAIRIGAGLKKKRARVWGIIAFILLENLNKIIWKKIMEKYAR